MKKNIFLAIIGVVFMLGLVGCPNTPTADFEGVWKVTGGIAVEYEDNADRSEYYIVIDSDGQCWETYFDKTTYKNTPYMGKFKITNNTCNTIECEGLKYTYEKSGDNMSWTVQTGSALVDAIAGPYYKMEKQDISVSAALAMYGIN